MSKKRKHPNRRVLCTACLWQGERAKNLPKRCPNCGKDTVIWQSELQARATGREHAIAVRLARVGKP